MYTETSTGLSEAPAETSSNDAALNSAVASAISNAAITGVALNDAISSAISNGAVAGAIREAPTGAARVACPGAPQLRLSQDPAQTATSPNADIENAEALRPELAHTLSLIFTHLLTEASSRLGHSETEGAQERAGGEDLQEFEVLLHAVPLQRSSSSHNIIFTIIYQMAEESPRTKAVDIKVLDEAVPEEKTERAEGECSICLETIEAGATLRRLKCLHFFHSQCVTEWLTKHTNECPMCRMVAVDNLEDTD